MNSGSPSGLRRALGWLPSSPTTARDALQRVRGASMRVALISTAIVAAVYLVISVTVATIVTSRLTSGVDTQLTSTLDSTLGYVPGIDGSPPLRDQAELSSSGSWTRAASSTATCR